MEGYDYDAAASTVKINDITSDDTNRDILRRLKENDPDFDMLEVVSRSIDDCECLPESAHDLGWVGCFIGKNTTLKELTRARLLAAVFTQMACSMPEQMHLAPPVHLQSAARI